MHSFDQGFDVSTLDNISDTQHELHQLFKPITNIIDISTDLLPNVLFYTTEKLNISKKDLYNSSMFCTFTVFTQQIIDYLNKMDKENVIFVNYKRAVQKKNTETTDKIIYELFEKLGSFVATEVIKNCWIIKKEEQKISYKLIAGSPDKLIKTYLKIKTHRASGFKIIQRNNRKSKISTEIPDDIKALLNEKEKQQLNNFKKKFENFKLNFILKNYFNVENIKTDQLKKFLKKPNVSVDDIFIRNFLIPPNRILNFMFLIARKTMKDIFDRFNLRILRIDLEKIICGRQNIKWIKTHIIHYKISKLNLFKKNLKNSIGKEVHLNRTKIFIAALNMIICQIITPILNKNFYYLEFEEGAYLKPFYLLKRTSSIYFDFCRKTAEEGMEEITPKMSMYNTSMVGRLLIKPKKGGYRQLFDMSKSYKPDTISANNTLKQTFLFLKHQTLGEENNLMNGFYKYGSIWHALSHLNQKNKIIIKIDAVKCFDNINREIIKRVMADLLTDDTYEMKIFKKLPIIQNETTEFIINKLLKKDYVKQINDQIFVKDSDIGISEEEILKISKDELLKNIKKLCNRVVIESKNKYYIKKTGIPQGANLSNILCLIFFAYLDCRFFNQIFKKSKIIRYYDDMLIISEDLCELKNFILKKEELEKFGFKFDINKIETNVLNDSLNHIEKVVLSKSSSERKKVKITTDETKTIKWCGVAISNSGISIDFNIRTSNFYSYENPGLNLKLFLIGFMKRRINMVFFQSTNSRRHWNFYNTFSLYFKFLKARFMRMPFINKKLLKELIDYPLSILEKRILNSKSKMIVTKIYKEAVVKNGIDDLIKRSI
ncbi:Telomerase reverse transcriptase [Cucumispora dikerogammari]|nr:Telomerase reverse transcriptase [Cucumispora dikerogammari]